MNGETSRRGALKCLGVGAGTLFTLSGGIFGAVDLAHAASATSNNAPLFVQISDSHIGFNKDANPDVIGTLSRSIDLVNALPRRPAFAIHTGDITHLSKAEQFDTAKQLLSRLRVGELHAVPGEHDVTDGPGAEFFAHFGNASNNRGWYSFDAQGVHFVALINVMQFRAGGLGALGEDQLVWLKADLFSRSASQPIVVFAHMPLWTIYEPWGWGTAE
ncbi:MAG TPA: metallophosphoesterase, partial [Rhizomicrobium sp.]